MSAIPVTMTDRKLCHALYRYMASSGRCSQLPRPRGSSPSVQRQIRVLLRQVGPSSLLSLMSSCAANRPQGHGNSAPLGVAVSRYLLPGLRPERLLSATNPSNARSADDLRRARSAAKTPLRFGVPHGIPSSDQATYAPRGEAPDTQRARSSA